VPCDPAVCLPNAPPTLRAGDAGLTVRLRAGGQAERAALAVAADAPALPGVDDLAAEVPHPFQGRGHVGDGEVGERHPVAGPRAPCVQPERGTLVACLPPLALPGSPIRQGHAEHAGPEVAGAFGIVSRELDETDGGRHMTTIPPALQAGSRRCRDPLLAGRNGPGPVPGFPAPLGNNCRYGEIEIMAITNEPSL
jgi:hypothetical protein